MRPILISAVVLALTACQSEQPSAPAADTPPAAPVATAETPAAEPSAATDVEMVPARPGIYADFTLTADMDHLSDNQRRMVSLLIDASVIMDGLFWQQAYGNKDALLESLSGDDQTFARYNYGPWDLSLIHI